MNSTTKKVIWSSLGFFEGVFLLAQGPNIFAVAIGVVLCSVSILIAIDTFRSSAIETAVFSVIGFFSEQRRRISAVYKIYQMAPDIAAARENYLLALPPPEAADDGRTQMWREMSQAEVAPKAKTRKTKAVAKAAPRVNTKIEYVSYADAGMKNLKLGLLTSDVYARIQAEHTLILTDIGSSEVGASQLRDYSNNKLSLSFWIAKKIIGDCDLLVIQRETLAQESEIMPRVLQRLSEDYQKVLIFVHRDLEQNIKGAFVPSSEQIINTQTILE